MSSSETDSSAFRGAQSQFATGVTIVTTRQRPGQDIGLTANRFAKRSVDKFAGLVLERGPDDIQRAACIGSAGAAPF